MWIEKEKPTELFCPETAHKGWFSKKKIDSIIKSCCQLLVVIIVIRFKDNNILISPLIKLVFNQFNVSVYGPEV